MISTLWVVVFPSAGFLLSVDKGTKVSKLSWVRAICSERLLPLHNRFQTLVHRRDVGRAYLDWLGRHDAFKAWMYDILETCHFSLQLTRGMNNRGQFICVRYLPNAALLLVRKSHLMVTLLLLMLRFPSWGLSRTAFWSNSLNGRYTCGGYSTHAC